MNPHDKNKNPISSLSNSPPCSSSRPPGTTQPSDMPPPQNTVLFPSSSDQLEHEFSSISSEVVAFPLSMASPFVDFEFFQSLEEAVPERTAEAGESFSGVPQPMECLQGTPVPPFLSKTFDLVDDPALDAIISWGANGQSFVVWDPVEFSRIILPRNFKHNNFSSFVRQLNTYLYLNCVSMEGFRKIDADKWEFANEGFSRGNKHLLKNIQRRKSPQSQHVGSSSSSASEAGKAALEGEIDKLRKERSLMMQEVVELQQHQRGAIQHMEMVNEKLQAAEQRQKHMVSFLVKVFQNPAFLSHLKQIKEQTRITSSRTMRKVLKHQQHEPAKIGGQIMKHRPDLLDFTPSSISPDLNPVAVEQLPEFPLQDTRESLLLQSEYIPSQTGHVASDEMIMANELLRTSEQAGEHSNQGSDDPRIKGKNIVGLPQDVMPEYVVSFPDDSGKEKTVAGFSSLGIESMVKEQELWTMGFEAGPSMSTSKHELWGNVSNYEIPELGVSSGLSDIWDLGSLQAPGSSYGVEKWPDDESPFRELDDQAGQRSNV